MAEAVAAATQFLGCTVACLLACAPHPPHARLSAAPGTTATAATPTPAPATPSARGSRPACAVPTARVSGAHSVAPAGPAGLRPVWCCLGSKGFAAPPCQPARLHPLSSPPLLLPLSLFSSPAYIRFVPFLYSLTLSSPSLFPSRAGQDLRLQRHQGLGLPERLVSGSSGGGAPMLWPCIGAVLPCRMGLNQPPLAAH